MYAATTICELFGAALLRQRAYDSSGNAEGADACAAGFAVLSQGEGSFRQALRDLARNGTGTKIAPPRQAFGKR